jgi:hypothetical protein
MPKIFPTLSANPLEIVRSFPTTLVPLDQIKIPEGLPKDEIFLSRYISFLQGKTLIHESRASLKSIRRGFWCAQNGDFELQGDSPDSDGVEEVKELIRLGSRPVLHLYENPNKADKFRYVCADDTALHAAYEQLGISVVPISLMGKPRDMEESCISVRSFKKGKNEWIPLIDGYVPTFHKEVPSILGLKKPNIGLSLTGLIESIEQTKIALRQFHKGGAAKFHYHHTLYSVLLRAGENIASMKMLVAAGNVLVAASLLRTLYELVLTFYVDWLSPGQTYRYLQLASVMSERDWEESCNKTMKQQISGGLSHLDAKNIKDAHMRGYRLCSVVGDKARIFPLGEKYQRDIYSFLSDILHHDFSMAARYTHTLDHGDDAVYNEDAAASILHVADILIAAIVSRIQADIGGEVHLAVTA